MFLSSTNCARFSLLLLLFGALIRTNGLRAQIPPSKVFLAQKFMIREANIAGKPVVTATQMLESMVVNPRPTRAECSDVANAVYDGTDVVMLSGETANGPHFEAAVHVMARCCCEAEANRNYNLLFQSVRNTIVNTKGRLSVGESVASSAVKTALDVKAKLIAVMSESGKMANYVAKFRPGVSVLCLTPNETAARQASGLLLGMHTVAVDSLQEADELLEDVTYELLASGMVEEGDKMVVIGGRMAGMKEQLRVVDLYKGKYYGHIVNGKSFFFERSLLLNYVP